MQRLTITIDDELVAEVDDFIAKLSLRQPIEGVP
jgi:metal-responsive CopG/Arc/MetJ family transcriptional regulator